MKTIFISALIMIAILFASCNDMLNFPDYDKLPQKDFWQNQADAESALTACYGQFSSDWAFYNSDVLGPEQVASGNTVKGSTVGSNEDVCEFSDFSFTSNSVRLNNLWLSRYALVNKCNQVLDHVPSIKMDETAKNEIIGEAKFIRAWTYFEMVRLFGEVVVYDGLPKDGVYDIPKSSVADIYSFILRDLDEASLQMRKTAWDPQWKGRLVSYAALALKAKVLMYMADGANFMSDGKAINGKTWKDVEKVADDVVQKGPYHLYHYSACPDSSFFYLFRLKNENCEESIFESQNGVSKDFGSVASSAYALNTWVKAGRDGGFGYSVPSDELVEIWKKRYQDQHDLRYKYSIIFKGEKQVDGDIVDGTDHLDGVKGIPRYNYKVFVPKYDRSNIIGQGWMKQCEQNQRFFRFSDVLLIDAEAKLRNGNAAEACRLVNMVRNRAGEPEIQPGGLTLSQIWDERRFELAFENDYYFDLIRTGQAKSVLGSHNWHFPKNVFYPIPQPQLDLSHNILKQNKLW